MYWDGALSLAQHRRVIPRPMSRVVLAAGWLRLDLHDLPIHGKSLLTIWQQAMEGAAAVSCSLGNNVGTLWEIAINPIFLYASSVGVAGQGQVCRAVLWRVWVLTATPHLCHVDMSFVVVKALLESKLGSNVTSACPRREAHMPSC